LKAALDRLRGDTESAFRGTEQSWDSHGIRHDSSAFIHRNILDLLVVLNSEDRLPAIVFNFDRNECEKILETLVTTLETRETEERVRNAAKYVFPSVKRCFNPG